MSTVHECKCRTKKWTWETNAREYGKVDRAIIDE